MLTPWRVLAACVALACVASPADVSRADDDPSVSAAPLHVEPGAPSKSRVSQALSAPSGIQRVQASGQSQGKESCGCEDDFPPGAGFAFRREGYAMLNLEGGKASRQRQFFETKRITFKEILAHGDGRTLPQVSPCPPPRACLLGNGTDVRVAQVGQRTMLRYTEFTSNECLALASSIEGKVGVRLHQEDIEHSVLSAIEDLEDLVMKMSVGEKAMFFASYDLGVVRTLQAWLQWWLEATCSEMSDAGARIFEVQLVSIN